MADRRIRTLERGKLLPRQWTTSAFSQAGPLHLIGNLVFLAKREIGRGVIELSDDLQSHALNRLRAGGFI